MKKRLLLVNDFHAHFGGHSGYNNVFRYLNEIESLDIVHAPAVKKIQQSIFGRLLAKEYSTRHYGPHHHFQKYLEEYVAFKNLDRIKPDIIHFPFAEDCFGYFSDNKHRLPKGIKMIGTIHQPPSWWKMTKKNPKVLEKLDTLIVLSSEALEYFATILSTKVVFIPHAIDSDFFTLPKTRAKTGSHNILFVGNWLRDFQAFSNNIQSIIRAFPDVVINIVYPYVPEAVHPLYRLLKYESIHWHKDISDVELRCLYYAADILFLPLIDSTANNALLEAASTGLPIITNDCGGLRDYFNTKNMTLVDFDNHLEVTSAVRRCLSPETRNEALGKALTLAQETRRHFDVSVIAETMLKLYQAV